jgi:hypothetical protein
MNGVEVVDPIDTGVPTVSDIANALLVGLGCSYSRMPAGYPNRRYTDQWEYFDPELVEDPDELPEHWRMIYDMHMRPDMADCRDLMYTYLHSPVDIMSAYPDYPTMGIFCVTGRVDPKDIRRRDIVNINSDLEE